MGELQFVSPSEQYLEEARAYREEFLAAGSSMDGAGPLRRYEDPATVPEGKVEASQYLCVRDGRILGMLQLRRRLNDYLRNYAGHIGYSVRPSERRKGVATWMLAQALPRARAFGLTRVMIACEPWNEGSRRVILANGGVWERTVHEPEEDIDLEQYWIQL